MPQNKKNEVREKLFSLDHIKEYLDDKWKAELYNRDAFMRLHELYSNDTEYPLGNGNDQKAKDAIIQKMIQFKKAIMDNSNKFIALSLDFNKYKFQGSIKQANWDDEEE
jgi:hypothetical protein